MLLLLDDICLGFRKICCPQIFKLRDEKYSSALFAKQVTESYVCTECGENHVKWVGRCTSCKEWNTVKAIKLSPMVSSIGVNQNSRKPKGWISQAGGENPMMLMSNINTSESIQRVKVWR